MSNSSKLYLQEKIPTFIRKTYEILEENRFPDIIDWSKDEKSLVIFKPTDFASQVLPLYFKHNHLTSFVRQLHMYNFHKRRSVGNDHIYYHELFQKNKRYLLKNIRKKKSDQNQDQSPSIQALENARKIADVDETFALSSENDNLKKMHQEAMSKIKSLEDKIKNLTQQNHSLWSQISPQSQGDYSSTDSSINSYFNTEQPSLSAEKFSSQSFINSSYEFQPSKLDDLFTDLPVFCNFLNCEEQFGDCLETASQSYISSQLSPNDNYDSKGHFYAQEKQNAKVKVEANYENRNSQKLVAEKPRESIKLTFGSWSLESNNFRMLSINNNQGSNLLSDSSLLCKREFQQEENNFELEKMDKPRKLVHTSQNYFEAAPETMRIF